MITERDHVARRHPGVAEPKRGGVRASVELAVGDGLPFGGHGRRVGLGGATLADEIGHTFGAWLSRSRVPFDQLTSLLGRREDRHARRGLCRIGGDGGDDARPVLGHSSGGRVVEEIAVVYQPAGEVTLRSLVELELEVELGRAHLVADLALHLMQRPIGIGRHQGGLEHDHRLVDGVGGAGGLGIEVADNSLEGHEPVERRRASRCGPAAAAR